MFAAGARAGNRAVRRDARTIHQRRRPRDARPIDAGQAHAVTLEVVSTAERPELVPTVARWVWGEFWRRHGHTLGQTADAVGDCNGGDLPQTTSCSWRIGRSARRLWRRETWRSVRT